MNFEELRNIINNFCDAHSFEAFGEPVFDYDHQCYNYDIPSTFYNSLSNVAFENKKLTRILVRLTEKEILNNKEKSIILILRNIESLLEKHEHFENEYIRQSNRAKSHEELQSLHIKYNAVTRDVKRVCKDLYSFIEDLEYLMPLAHYVPERKHFLTEQRYLEVLQYIEKSQAEECKRFEKEYQRYGVLIADILAKIEQQLSKLNQKVQDIKLAS